MNPTKGTRNARRTIGWTVLALLILPMAGGAVSADEPTPPEDAPADDGCWGFPCQVVSVGACNSPTTFRHVVAYGYRECIENDTYTCMSGAATLIDITGDRNVLCAGGLANKCSFNVGTTIHIVGNDNHVCVGDGLKCIGGADVTIYVTGHLNRVCSGGSGPACESTVVTIVNTGFGNTICNRGPLVTVENSVNLYA